MKISIQMISLGSHELFFLFDHQHQPVIEVKGVQYDSLAHLLQTFPPLYDQKNLKTLAQITNFFAKGVEFQYIEDIEAFSLSYYQQVEEEQSSLLYEGSAIKDYGIFDLSAMHPPKVENQTLIFFVRHDYLHIPYRVTFYYPSHPEKTLEISYELLPLERASN